MESKSNENKFVKVITENLLYKTLIIIALILFFIYASHYIQKKPNATEIKVASSTIFAQIADSENERSLGLSFTKQLDENAGMLFIFDDTSVKNFWMRDMLFDIDIIWLDENKQVVGFFENVSKDSYNKKYPDSSRVYRSPDSTKYVLEVNAGVLEKLKIKVSDKLNFNY
jgi:uncharacterized membrane protein (UPF0127 family)